MKKYLKRETVFYGAAKYSTVVVTLLTTAILSRILTPSEYGIVSVVTVFTAFFTILADLGLGTAVIQNKTLDQQEINDIYSFSVYFAVCLGIVFALLGFPIASFYGNGIYRSVCLILGISVLFNAMNIVPNALLMKAKRFRLVGFRLIVVAVVTGVVAILLALLHFSYYALVIQSVLQAALIFFWNRTNVDLRFSLRFHRASIEKVRSFSTYQFLYNFINYFARNLDNLLIGKVLGNESLAYYDKGYRLMMYPIQNLTYVINPVLHPILSEYQDNRRYIYDSYMKVVRVLSTLGVFISLFCFWNSREIVLLFFGGQWEASIPVFRILSLSVWPQLVSSSAGSIYQSTGNTKMMFRSGVIHFSLTIALIVIGVLTGDLSTVAVLVAVSLYCRFFIDYYFLVARNFQYSYLKFLGSFFWDTVTAAVLLAGIGIFHKISIDSSLLSLAVKGILLLALYAAVLFVTKQWVSFKTIFKSKRG